MRNSTPNSSRINNLAIGSCSVSKHVDKSAHLKANRSMASPRVDKFIDCNNVLDKENKTSECERHVSATPVPSSVYRWNYNEEQYIVEN